VTALGLSIIAAIILVMIALPIYLTQTRKRTVANPSGAAEESTEVYFTPGDQAANAVVEQLNAAKESVHVQAYSFTSAPIAKALVDAKKRGVPIIVILDVSNKSAKYSSADFLVHEGLPTFLDRKHAIAHNKIMIIDDAVVITGSFNFTKAAQESNAENLLILHDKRLAMLYEANWQKHFAHSDAYGGR
jgi:phosphatidylserine/phosphatidylglycerophosphate/cardiolipin synthase-like enzyme